MTGGLHLVVHLDVGGAALVVATGRLTVAAVDELLRVVDRTRALADVPLVVDLTDAEVEAEAAAQVRARVADVPGAPVEVRLRRGARGGSVAPAAR
ncbi:hypothetical protein [Cellulomonas hominis]|uniref:hypothetical protein n=1 Tax=Cellulomonas hominis TaxID=156981 RepID=UPI00144455CF|nr:hypothetical protein [Cellulomonas hominis]NKY09340.1 hypothetical protein [Cellulomonas hominis]